MRWCDADNSATAEVNNPATGEILGKVPLMGRAETRRAGRVWRVAEGLESGMVGHQHRHDFDGSRPVWGVKHSGLGRGGSHYGMDEFVEVKYLCLGGIEQPKSAPSSSPDQPGGQS